MGTLVFGKAKNDCRWGGDALPFPPFFFFFFVYKTHYNSDRWGEYRVENISNYSVVTLNNVLLKFSTIISLSLQNM